MDGIGTHRGEGVVGALPLVDVVVGVYQALVAQLAAQNLNRAVGNHLWRPLPVFRDRTNGQSSAALSLDHIAAPGAGDA